MVMWSRPAGAGAGLNQLHLCFALGDLLTPVLMNRSLAWTGGTWGMAIPVGAVVVTYGDGPAPFFNKSLISVSSSSCRVGVGGGAAPPAGHPLDLLGENLFLLDGEVAPDRVVVEGPRPPGGDHVEASDVAAGGAPVPGSHGAGP